MRHFHRKRDEMLQRAHDSNLMKHYCRESLKLAAFAFIASVLAACAGTGNQQPLPSTALNVKGIYMHNPSGMIFPLSVGDFNRDIINYYDSRQLEVTVDYDLGKRNTSIAAVVYVYPSSIVRLANTAPADVETGKTALCQTEFNTRKNEIIDAYPGVQVLIEEDVISRQRGTVVPGKTAKFEYEGDFTGKRQHLRSRLDLFCHLNGHWTVAYRFTYPASLDAKPVISRFMADFEQQQKQVNISN